MCKEKNNVRRDCCLTSEAQVLHGSNWPELDRCSTVQCVRVKAASCQFLGGLTGAESIRAKLLSVAERTLSPHLSNYSDRPGSALSHSLWGHEINTRSATINKCLFQMTAPPRPPLPSSSLGFRNFHCKA